MPNECTIISFLSVLLLAAGGVWGMLSLLKGSVIPYSTAKRIGDDKDSSMAEMRADRDGWRNMSLQNQAVMQRLVETNRSTLELILEMQKLVEGNQSTLELILEMQKLAERNQSILLEILGMQKSARYPPSQGET